MEGQSSMVEDFRIPPESVDVEITGILDHEGKPARVRLHRPDARELAELIRMMPGHSPPTAEDESSGDQAESNEERIVRIARPLIEKYASVQRRDGTWTRPAFRFGPGAVDAGLLPGDCLTYLELAGMGLKLLQLGGYAGGAADASFLGERGGLARSV